MKVFTGYVWKVKLGRKYLFLVKQKQMLVDRA